MRTDRALWRSAVIPVIAFIASLLARSQGGICDSVALATSGYDVSASVVRLSRLAAKPLPGGLAAGNSIQDWPQVQRDPQRSGYSPELLGADLEIAWTHPFQPEKVYPQVQAIVYQGKVFVGTEMGNLYALNAETGEEEWARAVGAPILNSVAAGDGRVYFGAMDGAVYALNAATGDILWKNQLMWRLGFSTAPTLVGSSIMLGGRDGTFYALEETTGTLLWARDLGSPILQTAAADDSRVYVAAMDMHVYALSIADGTLAWSSERLQGLAFKDYWPVVHEGRVVIRAMGTSNLTPGFPFAWFDSTEEWNWILENGPTIAAGDLTAIAEAMDAQDALISEYEADPAGFELSLHILDAETGSRDMVVVPHWGSQTMNGSTTPPCVDRDGLLIIPTYFVRSGWGRLSLESGRVIDILYDHRDGDGGTIDAGDRPAGMGNRDENLNVSCTADSVIAMHTQEGNANYTGVFSQDERLWRRLRRGHTNREMSTNTQGGGGNPASVAGGLVYHISYHELIARNVQ